MANTKYREFRQSYTRVDGLLAIAVFVLLMVAWNVIIRGIGDIIDNTLGPNFDMTLVGIIIALVVLIFVRKRKQSLESVGLSKNNLGKSAILGLAYSIIVIVLIAGGIGGIPAFGAMLVNPDKFMMIFHMFISVALFEEFIFRSYIQTRIHGLIKSSFFAIILVGIMFSLIHLFIDIWAVQHSVSFVSREYTFFGLFILFMHHVIFNLMYIRFNNIAAPLIGHAIFNLAAGCDCWLR